MSRHIADLFARRKFWWELIPTDAMHRLAKLADADYKRDREWLAHLVWWIQIREKNGEFKHARDRKRVIAAARLMAKADDTTLRAWKTCHALAKAPARVAFLLALVPAPPPPDPAEVRAKERQRKLRHAQRMLAKHEAALRREERLVKKWQRVTKRLERSVVGSTDAESRPGAALESAA